MIVQTDDRRRPVMDRALMNFSPVNHRGAPRPWKHFQSERVIFAVQQDHAENLYRLQDTVYIPLRRFFGSLGHLLVRVRESRQTSGLEPERASLGGTLRALCVFAVNAGARFSPQRRKGRQENAKSRFGVQALAWL